MRSQWKMHLTLQNATSTTEEVGPPRYSWVLGIFTGWNALDDIQAMNHPPEHDMLTIQTRHRDLRILHEAMGGCMCVY